MVDSIKHFVAAKYDYITGSLAGSIYGFTTVNQFQFIKSLAGAIIFSIVTGAAGALGAHLFKLIAEKLKSNGKK